jgi:1,4-alpha-glucan branching enzyme
VQFLENQDLTYAGHAGAARIAMLADASGRRSWYARSRSRVVTSLLLAAPGIPSLFMGEEFLEDKNWSDDRRAGGLIWWEGLDDPDPAMRDFLRCVGDLVQLRRTQPALRAPALGLACPELRPHHRAAPLGRREGRDVVVIASLDEAQSTLCDRLPFAGSGASCSIATSTTASRILVRSETVAPSGLRPPLDGFGASAALTLPANGVIELARE